MHTSLSPKATRQDPSRDDIDNFKRELLRHMTHTIAKVPARAQIRDWYQAVAHTVRDVLAEAYLDTTGRYVKDDRKRIYYLSLEFLIGRSLVNNLLNVGLYDVCVATFRELGVEFADVAEAEAEAGLGNGGLGRLAACFVDSLATLGMPGYGYGLRYQFGMFRQALHDNEQVEQPDNWLRYGNPWEFERPNAVYSVHFGGEVVMITDHDGRERYHWRPAHEVRALPYDMPVAGVGGLTVNHIRLWSAKAPRAFDLARFNRGDYIDSVSEEEQWETLTRVLYPDDSTHMGKELRFRQEYFFVSATVQDILRRHLDRHPDVLSLADKVALQLNDTHPSIAVAELMRLLLDHHHLDWGTAWSITVGCCSYTNHTLLPEALETWPVHLFEQHLPRHLQIIYEINRRFLEEVRHGHPGDLDLLRAVSLIDESGGHRVRMAHLAFVGAHKVNGVARIHTDLMRSGIFRNLNTLFPDRIVNKTNGITPRRWLHGCNRGLSLLITENLGHDWVRDLERLRALTPLAEDPGFQEDFRRVKRENKETLAAVIQARTGYAVNPDSLFDVQVKRIHEYKRQLLNLMGVVERYLRLRDGQEPDPVPRTVILAGKAAPSYVMAKHIIRLANDMAEVINHDPRTHDHLKLVFLPDYNVSLAECIMPAADLSQQISTAGTEASGTGNMKLALNGALTLGTRDGANIEIAEEVGQENIFFFGLNADEVEERRTHGYNPWHEVEMHAPLRRVIETLQAGYFSDGDHERVGDILYALLDGGDHYLHTADFADYLHAQERVDALYRQQEDWTHCAILNVARMGRFSSDLTIKEYAREIWNVIGDIPGTTPLD